LGAGLELLRGAEIDAEAAELDSHLRQTACLVGAVDNALSRLDARAFLSLQAARARPPAELARERPREGMIDAIAAWLTLTLRNWPVEAGELAVATGRLVEESRALLPAHRRTVPLGRGFENQREDRLRLRFGLLPEHQPLLGALDRHRRLLLEAPDEGVRAIERAAGRALSAQEREWLSAERFVGMLDVASRTSLKTEGGHIRWFLRRDPVHGIVLDRYGAHGHWLVTGAADGRTLARCGTFAARATDEARLGSSRGWRALVLADERNTPGKVDDRLPSNPLALDEAYRLAPVSDGRDITFGDVRRGLAPADPNAAKAAILGAGRAARYASRKPRLRSYALGVSDDRLSLATTAAGHGGGPLASAALDADDDALLDFLDVVGRVADAASIADRVDERYDGCEAVRWTRGLLAHRPPRSRARSSEDLSGLNVRLVYVPASQPHPLGGLPLIGLRFVADHLERLGARADVVTILAQDVERRLIELLGAEVIGLSLYLTNREEVARLVALLRRAGFTGRIVLGGPELREIDLVQETVTGWDALIRGEGEEVFPQVIRVLRHLDAGETDRGLALARTLRGVVIAHRDLLVLADTAARNSADEISCPLPFEWRRYGEGGTLKMNFTRGCPYECGFCPNHQGRKFHSCGADEMWTFAERAAADALRLPRAEEDRCAAVVQEALGIDAPPRLRLALDLLLRRPVAPRLLERLCGGNAGAELRGRDSEAAAALDVTPWEAKGVWLRTKAKALPTLDLVAQSGGQNDTADGPALEPFELMTSEDNTLVNDLEVRGFMERRRRSGLSSALVFNPGQNTVRDLTDHQGEVNTDYVDLLCDANPFKVVLGVDGTSNPVLRQNHKPYYSIADAVAVNRALARRGVEVLNNYILLTPETDLLEAIEAMTLFVVLPIRWRDHGASINLRIIKEPGTRSHDEGLLFAPEDSNFVDPLRFPAVEALLQRWGLTWSVTSADLPEMLWRVLEHDPDAQRLLPLVVRRWERNFEDDPFLVALAARIRAASRPGSPLIDVLRRVAKACSEDWLSDYDDTELSGRAGREPAQRSRRPRGTPHPVRSPATADG
jgi:methylmalonyl-CoA mutase cobalamin-binding subunit